MNANSHGTPIIQTEIVSRRNNMNSIDKAIKFKNIAALDIEIEDRKELIKNMVGTLYPRIVMDEIIKLKKRRKDIADGLQ